MYRYQAVIRFINVFASIKNLYIKLSNLKIVKSLIWLLIGESEWCSNIVAERSDWHLKMLLNGSSDLESEKQISPPGRFMYAKAF